MAERLGHWLDWTDAVELSAVLNQPVAVADAGPADAPSAALLAQALTRLQADQARQIGSDPVYLPGNGLGSAVNAGVSAGVSAGVNADDAADAAPYRRAAQARQRAMAAAVAPLRARLRAALAAGSPALARLAALDATLENALRERERHLLGGVVAQIEQRFHALRGAGLPDWRLRLHQDMQQALLAELDLRLQPLLGLLDALRQERRA